MGTRPKRSPPADPSADTTTTARAGCAGACTTRGRWIIATRDGSIAQIATSGGADRSLERRGGDRTTAASSWGPRCLGERWRRLRHIRDAVVGFYHGRRIGVEDDWRFMNFVCRCISLEVEY